MRRWQVKRWKWVLTAGIAAVMTGLAIFAAGLAATYSQTWEAFRGGRVAGLVCERNSHNFGEMTLRQAVQREHIFLLKNTSDHPIRIIKQSNSCGCIVANIPEDAIAPGEEISVPIQTDWKGKAGTQKAIVTFVTDDPLTPYVELQITGFVKVPAIVVPANVNFGSLKPGQQVSRVVELSPGTDPRPFRLMAVENPSPNISIARLPETPGEKAKPLLEGAIGKFSLQIIAPPNSGREETRIIFRTDLDDRPEVLLHVTAKFEGPLRAMPHSIFFANPDDKVLLKEVQILSNKPGGIFNPQVEIAWNGDDANPFFIKRVYEAGEIDGKAAVMVTVGCQGKEVKQLLSRAVLRITTSESDSLEVPLVAMGRPK